ncbi:MAG: hypothetical protein O3C27_04865 [Actinomycetota bacterium]|nr:hypothetical protein [Actinomycetota bacterium]
MCRTDNPITLKLLAGIAASALLFSACGSGGSEGTAASDGAAGTEGTDASGGGDNDALVDDLASELSAETDSPFAEEGEARCAASNNVEGIGAERIAELRAATSATGGLETLDLTADEIDTVVAAFGECTDMVEFMTVQLATQFGDEAASCMMGELGEDFVNEAMAAGLAGDDPTAGTAFLESMMTATANCGVN